MDNRHEVQQFLTALRARITPEQAGLTAFSGQRRVPGLRREEVTSAASPKACCSPWSVRSS